MNNSFFRLVVSVSMRLFLLVALGMLCINPVMAYDSDSPMDRLPDGSMPGMAQASTIQVDSLEQLQALKRQYPQAQLRAIPLESFRRIQHETAGDSAGFQQALLLASKQVQDEDVWGDEDEDYGGSYPTGDSKKKAVEDDPCGPKVARTSVRSWFEGWGSGGDARGAIIILLLLPVILVAVLVVVALINTMYCGVWGGLTLSASRLLGGGDDMEGQFGGVRLISGSFTNRVNLGISGEAGKYQFRTPGPQKTERIGDYWMGGLVLNFNSVQLSDASVSIDLLHGKAFGSDLKYLGVFRLNMSWLVGDLYLGANFGAMRFEYENDVDPAGVGKTSKFFGFDLGYTF